MGSIQRFVNAHTTSYSTALKEIKSGHKQSHWIWYIFPQLKGLGFSYMSDFYGIENLNEAQEYMKHPILAKHMIEICNALLLLDNDDSDDVMGYPDNLKLCSSMTLFKHANPDIEIFQKVLDKFFSGIEDEKTLEMLNYNF